MPEPDILQALRETMKEQTKNRGTIERIFDRGHIEKIDTIRRYFMYATDLLDLILRMQRDRRYRYYDW